MTAIRRHLTVRAVREGLRRFLALTLLLELQAIYASLMVARSVTSTALRLLAVTLACLAIDAAPTVMRWLAEDRTPEAGGW